MDKIQNWHGTSVRLLKLMMTVSNVWYWECIFFYSMTLTFLVIFFCPIFSWNQYIPTKIKEENSDLYTVRYLNNILFKYLLDKIYFMPFSINCTDRPWVYKINSSIRANKNISSTLCLSMERNWACPLQFYYRSSEGQPLDSSDPCRLPKGQRTRLVWYSTCCEPITWILFLQIFARLWIV